ncbi:MAG: hypothetical protein GY803_31380 [Chloroflexi bacterium]|nr:hypothetical protein [Chloroflexota bacterium]
MAYTTKVAKTAASDIAHFLESYWSRTVQVHNVEDDPAYQRYDVDLLWTARDGYGRLRVIPIEIKGDTYHKTGNFFLETVSNEAKGTPGCFLYTGAKWLFYYFVGNGRLYCLPMDKARPWFYENMDRFPERRTSTPVGNGEYYVTIGRLVPIQIALDEIEGVRQYEKRDEIWKPID